MEDEEELDFDNLDRGVPTQFGWYWYTSTKGYEQVVWVESSIGGLYVHVVKNNRAAIRHISDFKGTFGKRITPPSEEEE